MESGKSGVRKLGAAIYLKTFAPIPVKEFVSGFQRNWPETLCEAEDEEPPVTHLKIGLSHVAIELRRTIVPDSLTDSVLETTLHWPNAKRDISRHTAHIAVTASIDDGDAVVLASDLTKAVATLLAITDSLCVCWLNGRVLTLRDDFVSIANELLRIDQPPFLLWVGVNWNPDRCLLHTKGMAQFAAPELFLGKQSTVSHDVITYLHHLVRDVLSARGKLVAGQTIDGPIGVVRVEVLGGGTPNKTGLLLLPARTN
jgi:hypothetical protein